MILPTKIIFAPLLALPCLTRNSAKTKGTGQDPEMKVENLFLAVFDRPETFEKSKTSKPKRKSNLACKDKI